MNDESAFPFVAKRSQQTLLLIFRIASGRSAKTSTSANLTRSSCERSGAAFGKTRIDTPRGSQSMPSKMGESVTTNSTESIPWLSTAAFTALAATISAPLCFIQGTNTILWYVSSSDEKILSQCAYTSTEGTLPFLFSVVMFCSRGSALISPSASLQSAMLVLSVSWSDVDIAVSLPVPNRS
ncbi:hypothetical protein FQZ97_538960 [compost metagenome]